MVGRENHRRDREILGDCPVRRWGESHRRDREILGDCPMRWWGERTTEGTKRFWEIVL